MSALCGLCVCTRFAEDCCGVMVSLLLLLANVRLARPSCKASSGLSIAGATALIRPLKMGMAMMLMIMVKGLRDESGACS